MLPVAAHHAEGDEESIGDFLLGKPAKVLELDDFRASGIKTFQTAEGVVEQEKIHAHTSDVSDLELMDRFMVHSAASFGRSEIAGLVDENTTHRETGESKKVCPACNPELLITGQPKVSLVNKCGGLQRMGGAFTAHGSDGHFVELAIDKWRRQIAGGPVATNHSVKEFGKEGAFRCRPDACGCHAV